MAERKYYYPKNPFDESFVDDDLLANLFDAPVVLQGKYTQWELLKITEAEDGFNQKFLEIFKTSGILQRSIDDPLTRPDVADRMEEFLSLLTDSVVSVEYYRTHCDELSFEDRMLEIQIITDKVNQAYNEMSNWKLR